MQHERLKGPRARLAQPRAGRRSDTRGARAGHTAARGATWWFRRHSSPSTPCRPISLASRRVVTCYPRRSRPAHSSDPAIDARGRLTVGMAHARSSPRSSRPRTYGSAETRRSDLAGRKFLPRCPSCELQRVRPDQGVIEAEGLGTRAGPRAAGWPRTAGSPCTHPASCTHLMRSPTRGSSKLVPPPTRAAR